MMENQSSPGFLPLPRAFFDTPFWRTQREFSKAEAHLDLIQSARYSRRPTFFEVNGRTVEIGRGQVLGSYRYLSKRWDWSIKKVRTFIERLTQGKLIECQKTQGITVITLCDSSIYNFDRSPKGNQRARDSEAWEQSEGIQRAGDGTNQEKGSKEIIKDENSIAAPAKNQVEALYSAYPRHAHPAKGKGAIRQALESAPFEYLLERVKTFSRAVDRWSSEDRSHYVPMAHNWFEGRRWEEDETEWTKYAAKSVRKTLTNVSIAPEDFDWRGFIVANHSHEFELNPNGKWSDLPISLRGEVLSAANRQGGAGKS